MPSSALLTFCTLVVFIQLISFSLSLQSEPNPLVPARSKDNVADNARKDSVNNVITKKDACRLEISRICGSGDRVNIDSMTELEAFDCILNKQRDETTQLSNPCNQALWDYRKTLMSDDGFLLQLNPECVKDIRNSSCYKENHSGTGNTAPGLETVSCTVDNKDQLKDICRRTVSLVERVMFSDFELMEKFARICEKDIVSLECGRNDITRSKGTRFLPNSQGHTIECLSKDVNKLQPDCAVEIIRVAELQADDYHLDRALYFACRDDREKFCPTVSSGNGKVYKCLLKNKMDQTMSSACRDQLYRRQKLGWHDYRASGIMYSCKTEIRKNTCRKGASESDKHIRLSQILLCLENAQHNGQDLDGDCLDEMKQHRKSLMEDHRVTPELLVDCNDDITNFCKKGKGLNGRTIHCLMEHAIMRGDTQKINSKCRARLEDLVKMADVTEDWRVDPVLKESCQPVVAKSSCHDLPANRIMDCLMHLLVLDSSSGDDAHAMTEDCEIALFQIQYFVSRDFQLNSVLYSACHEDAKKICHASNDWSQIKSTQPNPGPMILSCLYRNIAGDDDDDNEKKDPIQKISATCTEQVKKTMQQRAISVHLMPEIEEPCLVDLAEKCSESTKNDEEMACLQNNLEGLDDNCKKAVTTFTKIELKNPTIDPYLWKFCHEIIETKCSSHMTPNQKLPKAQSSSSDEEDEDNLFECLVKTKPEIKSKQCRTTIDHYQLIQLKDIQFTPKFKTLCHGDVIRHCNDWHGQSKTSGRLVSCLSEIIWNDTINDNTPQISKGCRKQVKYLILSKIQIESKVEQGTIYTLCGNYVKTLCKGVTPGGGRVFECLRSNRDSIKERDCYNALFKLEEQVDNDDHELDVYLINECEPEIKLFCVRKTIQREYNPSLQTQNLIECLKLNREKEGFNNDRCGKVLQARLVERNTDARLNPTFRKACTYDIPKFCKNVPAGDGKVLGCLKQAFVRKLHLTTACKAYVQGMMQGAAEVDVKLDYTLYRSCEVEIQSHCVVPNSTPSPFQKENGVKIEDCLKSLFLSGSLQGTCKDQVQLLIQATEIDIHVDPSLNRACAIDLLKVCDGVPPGEGRLMACLLNELDREKAGSEQRLHPQCHKLLSARYELFQLAGSPQKLESLEDLYSTVAESQHKNYFLIMGITIVGIIFIFGLFCGRVTRRGKAAKNK